MSAATAGNGEDRSTAARAAEAVDAENRERSAIWGIDARSFWKRLGDVAGTRLWWWLACLAVVMVEEIGIVFGRILEQEDAMIAADIVALRRLLLLPLPLPY